MKRHSKAMEIIEQDELSFDDKVYVFENYHEGATQMNNLVSAHFTPKSIALSVEQCARHENFVDLCAGIGIPLVVVCVEHLQRMIPRRLFNILIMITIG